MIAIQMKKIMHGRSRDVGDFIRRGVRLAIILLFIAKRVVPNIDRPDIMIYQVGMVLEKSEETIFPSIIWISL